MSLRRIAAALIGVGIIASVSVAEAGPSVAKPSAKRGIASPVYLKTAKAKLTAAGGHWSYNWTPNVPARTASLDVVPMVWAAKQAANKTILAHLAKGYKNKSYKYLLGFNEPDAPKQSNITPSKAAALWPNLMRTHLTLGSPAVANPAKPWLGDFMRLVQQHHLRVDFIALHFYARIDDTAAALRRITAQVEAVHKKFHKPIWITELGITNDPKHPNPKVENWATAEKFMKSVTSMLDKKSYVQRYAWMCDNTGKYANLKWSSLYDVHDHLTPLGVTYSKL